MQYIYFFTLVNAEISVKMFVQLMANIKNYTNQ